MSILSITKNELFILNTLELTLHLYIKKKTKKNTFSNSKRTSYECLAEFPNFSSNCMNSIQHETHFKLK